VIKGYCFTNLDSYSREEWPEYFVEPLLIDRLAEYNRRQLAERRLRRRAQAAWACVWVVCAVVAVWIGWWLAR
jgi:hypothetical protein